MKLQPGIVDLGLYAVGWLLGWYLLWRPRPLPPLTTGRSPIASDPRPAVAVIVPARNEAVALPRLLAPLIEQLRPGDELVVIDDHSTDDTGQIAVHLGATVSTPPSLPDGWLGKPHACWHGALATSAPTLLFLDADVVPAPDLLDRVSGCVELFPDQVVSVQPWHRTGNWTEQASVLCNVAALMGSGAFTASRHSASPPAARRVAFGPVLAVRREVYEQAGGHASAAVRGMHTEDIALARAVGGAQLFTGAPDTLFRMYPGGFADTVRGWTRSIATGARFAPLLVSLATLAWISSLAGGWLATPLVYPLSAIQFWVLGRRAASVNPLTALFYPVAVVVFVAIFLRSLTSLVLRREVSWKGRPVSTR